MHVKVFLVSLFAIELWIAFQSDLSLDSMWLHDTKSNFFLSLGQCPLIGMPALYHIVTDSQVIAFTRQAVYKSSGEIDF